MLKFKGKRLQAWFCAALLFLVPLCIVLPDLFYGRVPAPVGSVVALAPWQEARTPGEAITETAPFSPEIQRYYPWYAFIGQAAKNREIPLWNPNEGFGAPFFSLWRTRAFSPFSLPFYLLPLALALQLSVFLKVLAAGWCGYHVARKLGYVPPFALLVAVALQLSPPVFVHRLEPVSDAAPWLPLLLLCIYRLISGEFRIWPLLAGTLAITVLSGSPESLLVFILVCVVALPVFRLRNRHLNHLLYAYAGLGAAIAAALGLTAFQLLPYYEYKGQTSVLLEPFRSELRPADLWALWFPGEASRPALQMLHIGVPALVMAALWFSLRKYANKFRRRRLESLLASAAILALAAFLSGMLNGENSVWPWPKPEHLLLLWPLSMAFLMAATAEEWIILGANDCLAVLRRFAAILLLTILGGVIMLAWRGTGEAPAFPAFSSAMGGVVFMAAMLLYLGVTLLKPKPMLAGLGLSLLVVVCGWHTRHESVQSTPAARAFPETGFIRALNGLDTRIAGSGELKKWPLSVHGISQVYNPSGTTLSRYDKFIQRAALDPKLMRLGAAGALLLTRQDIQGGFAELRPTLNMQEVFPSGAILLKDLDALPRARMVYKGKKVAGFDPNQLALEGPVQIEGGTLPEKDEGTAAKAQIVPPDSMNRVVVNIDETRPGLLVLADTWYPGWTATVDDVPAEVLPVDGVFRGVEVGEGAHEVVFTYRPFSLVLGLYVSAGTMIILLAGMWVFRKKKPRPAATGL